MKHLFFTALVMAILIGCGSGDGGSSKKDLKNITPDDWAGEVFSLYEKSIVKLDELIGTKPALNDELKKKVADLKNSIVDELIPLGKARAAMSETDQKLCSAKLELKLERITGNPAWGRALNDARPFYSKKDNDFGILIGSFNIITQYAQLELLKRQEPKEAARLGIQ